MSPQTQWWLTFVFGALVAAGCKPKIGDSCSLSTDCSASGDRLCDITQPGGYCTIAGCSAGSCPGEAICVAFQSSVSRGAACYDPQDTPRLQRTYCLRKCGNDDDCRGGYDCLDLGAADNPWGSQVLERGRVNGHVCAVPHSALPVPANVEAAVCSAGEIEFEEHVLWQAPVAGAGGADALRAGAAGAGGVAGDGAAAHDAGAGGAGGGRSSGSVAGAAGAGGTAGARAGAGLGDGGAS
jgi:hypothetical protein